jgi:hypothetical protein
LTGFRARRPALLHRQQTAQGKTHMSDIDLGATLTPEENQYFETGGNSQIPDLGTGSHAAEGSSDTDDGQPIDDQFPGGRPSNEQTRAEKMVSLSALHEERSRRKATESDKRALETQLAELRGKFSIIEQLQPAQYEAPAPTVENDIFGVVKHTTDSLAEIQRRLRAEDDQKRADGERSHLMAAYRMDAAQFEARTPDFKDAYNHLLNSRASELMAIGYDDPMALHQALTRDEISIAQMALSKNKSAAEIIYNLAQQRGYRGANGGKANASGKLDAIARGQNANKSLSNTGGNSGDGDVTGEMLLKMPMDEFEAWCTKNPAKAKRLMGG